MDFAIGAKNFASSCSAVPETSSNNEAERERIALLAPATL